MKIIAVHHLKCPHSTRRDCIITSSTGILPHVAVWWGPPWWWSLHPDLWGENNLLHQQKSKPALVSVVCLIASYWDPVVSENHWLPWISPKETYNFGTLICLTCCLLLFSSAVQTTVLPSLPFFSTATPVWSQKAIKMPKIWEWNEAGRCLCQYDFMDAHCPGYWAMWGKNLRF